MPTTIAARLADVPRTYPPVAFAGGKLRVLIEVFNFAGEAPGSHAIGAPLPAGAVPVLGFLVTSASTGTSTLAIGNKDNAIRYRSAATLSQTDTPVLFGPGLAVGSAVTATEQLLLTVGNTALPAAGRLVIMLLYVDNS
jgi:hypothetical protein